MKSLQFITLLLFVFTATSVFAQEPPEDDIDPETIDIVKPFEPVLADAVKVSLSPDLPDPTEIEQKKPVLRPYAVPNRFLTMNYDPVPLKPLAYKQSKKKSGSEEDLYNVWIKGGYGNINTPLLDVGVSANISDKTTIGAHGTHISSRSKNTDFQDYSHSNIGLFSKFFARNASAMIDGGYQHDKFYKYGYDHSDSTLVFTEDELQLIYQTISLGGEVSNSVENDGLIDYNFRGDYHNYFDQADGKENNIILNGKLSKQMGDAFIIGARTMLHFSSYKQDTTKDGDFALNLVPMATYQTHIGKFTGGLSLSIDGANIYPFPHLDLEAYALPEVLTVYAGWEKSVVKNNYMGLTKLNPYLAIMPTLQNTIRDELRIGFKGTVQKLVSYNLQFFRNAHKDYPLFVNDPTDTKQFNVIYEPKLRETGGLIEVGVYPGKMFRAELTLKIRSLKQEFEELPWHLPNHAWHMPTMDLNIRGEFTPVDKLNVAADIFILNGAYAQLADGTAEKLKGTADINLSARYQMLQNLGFFLNANNLLNRKYNRFYNYPTYGINFLGGAMVRF